MVFAVCFRLLQHPAEAEDVAQDVFVTIFKRIDDFRGESQLRTWVYAIALNQSRNRLRAQARRAHHAHESFDASHDDRSQPWEGAASVRQDDPARNLEAAERRDALMQAIARLSEEAREVIVLRDVEELSYDEIAVILGLAPGTVKSRIFRARAALRQQLVVDA